MELTFSLLTPDQNLNGDLLFVLYTFWFCLVFKSSFPSASPVRVLVTWIDDRKEMLKNSRATSTKLPLLGYIHLNMSPEKNEKRAFKKYVTGFKNEQNYGKSRKIMHHFA